MMKNNFKTWFRGTYGFGYRKKSGKKNCEWVLRLNEVPDDIKKKVIK